MPARRLDQPLQGRGFGTEQLFAQRRAAPKRKPILRAVTQLDAVCKVPSHACSTYGRDGCPVVPCGLTLFAHTGIIACMVKILPVPVLRDNYVWSICQGDSSPAILVDPGEAAPVLAAIQAHDWQLQAILLTHHHWDHTGGIEEILQHYPVPVYGPATEDISGMSEGLEGTEGWSLPSMGITLSVMAVPGHTRGALAYYIPEMVDGVLPSSGLVCSGDTLFAAGCGRLFEGTAEEMYASLQKFTDLPGDTLLCCGHEYTCANLRFAATVEPDNPAIPARLSVAEAKRHAGLPSVPEALALEWETNPFLRCHEQSVQEVVAAHVGRPLLTEVEVFAALREWKDGFR